MVDRYEYKTICNNTFRYDHSTGCAELVNMADRFMTAFEEEYFEKHGRHCVDIGEDGYYAIYGDKLDDETWNNPALLYEWALCRISELEAETDQKERLEWSGLR